MNVNLTFKISFVKKIVIWYHNQF